MTAVHLKGNLFSKFTRVVEAVRDWRGVDPSRADTSRGVNQRRRCGHEANHRGSKEELRRALQQLKARYGLRRPISQGVDKPRRAA